MRSSERGGCQASCHRELSRELRAPRGLLLPPSVRQESVRGTANEGHRLMPRRVTYRMSCWRRYSGFWRWAVDDCDSREAMKAAARKAAAAIAIVVIRSSSFFPIYSLLHEFLDGLQFDPTLLLANHAL